MSLSFNKIMWTILCVSLLRIKKTTAFGKEKILFHQHNPRVHICLDYMANIYELGYELLHYPLNFSEFIPIDDF